MPTETIIVTVAVIAVFGFFSVLLAWANRNY